MMWLVFCLVLVFVFLLVIVGSASTPGHTRRHARPEQPPVPTRSIDEARLQPLFKQRLPGQQPVTPRLPVQPPVTPRPPLEPSVRPKLPLEPPVRPKPPRRREEPVLELEDLFEPIQELRDVGRPAFDEDEIRKFFSQPSAFGGRSIINWDARCRLTGETHRVCSCDDCENLRALHGLD